jgi:hypothetical protein
VFGGPINGGDLRPPLYYFDAAGRPYVLLEEVGSMIERLVRLPSAVRQVCYNQTIKTKPEGELR